MSRPPSPLVIDARPLGPDGPFAAERLHGQSILARLLDLAETRGAVPVVVHARPEDQERLAKLADAGRFRFASDPPSMGAAVLRADRLYDPARLRRGFDPERAVIWRLDQPHGLAGAEDEFTRRQSYQPLGRYWALGPARLLARALCPTFVRPNAVTLASGALMLGASAGVAAGTNGPVVALALALALVLDTADGHLARLQGTASEFGRWLDAWLDELADMALHAATAWAAFARDGHPGWLALGMLYGMGKYQFLVGTVGGKAENGPSAETATTGRGSILVAGVRLAGHADVRWHLWIVLAAVGRLDVALVAYAGYFPLRALAGAVRKAVRRG